MSPHRRTVVLDASRMPASSRPAARPPLTPQEHGAWRRLIADRCGLEFGETRTSYLRRCLWERMRALGTASYGDYFRRIVGEPASRPEWRALLELLVNRETSFFRHPPSFEALVGTVLPARIAERGLSEDRTLSLWSAGCSTGEEAYSLAICALEAVASEPIAWRVQVIGSDISTTAVDSARRGVYRADRAKALSYDLRSRYTEAIEDGGRPAIRLRPSVHSIARFGHFNLTAPAGDWAGAQDVIFCQNLLVYQSPERRADLVRRLAERLRPGGFLFLAPGEVVGLKLPGVRPARFDSCLAYQRTG